jgi:uncharacterized protein YtpQ (UPF0354 family)
MAGRSVAVVRSPDRRAPRWPSRRGVILGANVRENGAMRTIPLALVLGLLTLASLGHAQDPGPPTPEEFTQEVLTALRRAAPGISFEIAGPLEIVGLRGAAQPPLHVSLEAIHASAPADPAERAESIRTYARRLLSRPPDTVGPADRPRVLPVIRDAGFAASVRRDPASAAVAEPLAADLWVLYALESPGQTRYLLESELAKLGVAGPELRALAVQNLSLKAPKAKLEEVADGVRWIVLDGVYESSFLLLEPFWARVTQQLGESAVAAVPTRDVLMFAAASDEGAVVRIREVAERFAAEQTHAISPRLLRREGKVWRALE